MTIGMLRQIIKEEISRSLLKDNDLESLEKEALKVDAAVLEAGRKLKKEIDPSLWKELNAYLGEGGWRIRFTGLIGSLKNPELNLTPGENWKMQSGRLLVKINNFDQWCRTNMPDSQELADLSEKFEKMMEKIEAAVKDEARRESSVPRSEMSRGEMSRADSLRNTRG